MHARTLAAVSLAVLACAPAAAAATPPDLTVTAAKPFVLAATGWKTYATVTVRNAGPGAAGKSTLSVTLKAPGLTRALTATGTAVPALGPRKSRTLSVTAALPPAVAPGTTFKLTVCADAKKKVRERKEKNNCKTSRGVLVTGPSTVNLANAALAKGLVSAGDAAVLKAQYVVGDPKLPVRYRGKPSTDDADGQAALVEIAAAYPLLPAADRKRLGPFGLPGGIRALVTSGKPAATARRAPAGAQSDCAYEFAGQTYDFNTINSFVYQGVSAAGGKAMVWWEMSRPQDMASALAYKEALDVAWPKLTGQFKEPLSDADRECLNAGAGSFDVYVNHRIGNLAQVKPMLIWTRTATGVVLDWGGCTHVPSYMEARPGLPRWSMAHELMHAIQFAYTYSDCGGWQNNWWDEGSASWAGDFVFPDDDHEHQWVTAFESPSAPIWRARSDYHTWVFWYFLAKTQGVSTLNSIFGALAGQKARAAVNSAIPGGYAQQFPLYLRWLRNGPPVGEPGFPVDKSYLGWDDLAARAKVSSETALGLQGAAKRIFKARLVRGNEADYCHPSETSNWYINGDVGTCVRGKLGPEAGVFQRFTFPDNALRWVKFENGMAGRAGQHVDAWFKLADGTWKAEDWSTGDHRLCRDKPAENVTELFLVSSNVAATGDGFAAMTLEHELEGRDHCPAPPYWNATFSGTTRIVTPPGVPAVTDFTTTFNGTFRLEPGTVPGVPLDPDDPTMWKIQSGTFRVASVSGFIGECTMSSSGATFTLPASNQVGPVLILLAGSYHAAVLPPQELPPLSLKVTFSGDPDKCSGEGDWPLDSLGVASLAASPNPIQPDEAGNVGATVVLSEPDRTQNLTFLFTPEY